MRLTDFNLIHQRLVDTAKHTGGNLMQEFKIILYGLMLLGAVYLGHHVSIGNAQCFMPMEFND